MHIFLSVFINSAGFVIIIFIRGLSSYIILFMSRKKNKTLTKVIYIMLLLYDIQNIRHIMLSLFPLFWYIVNYISWC